MKLKYYHYIILALLILLIVHKVREHASHPIQTTRSFTGPRNHFVGLGYPDWGDEGFK